MILLIFNKDPSRNTCLFFGFTFSKVTDAEVSLHTLLVKYYNYLLGRQSSERGRDEVTYFSIGDLFCTQLGTKYANFQGKIFR